MKRIIDEIKYDAGFIKDHTLQPQWYKVLKIILGAIFLSGYYFFFGGNKLLIFCLVFFGLSLAVHLLYRFKTVKYTRSWLDFKIIEGEEGLEYQRIGIYYYLLVAINFVIAILVSQFVFH